MLRLSIIGLFFIVAALEQPRAEAATRPNFLVILADDLGFSDVGCYGGEIETPHLDALAAGGLRYTQFYNTARCWPTRAALLTGYYAQQVGFDDLPNARGRRKRPAWAPLLPEYLRPLGYRSYHSGKWHLDGRPLEAGFDRSYWVEDYDRFFSPQDHRLDDRRLPPVDRGSDYYNTTAIAQRAIEFLRQHAEQHGDAPFFQYVAFLAPHFPLHALPEDIAHYADRYRAGWDAIRHERWQRIEQMLGLPGELSALEARIGPNPNSEAKQLLGPGEVYRELAWSQLTSEQQAFQAAKMAVHAAMVDRMDREIGRIVDQLRAMNSLDNTVIMFLSDNGASQEILVRGDGHDPSAAPGSAGSFLCLGPGFSSAANTPFRRHKMWVHEGGIATPFIVHWPSGFPARGALRHTAGHVVDIAPTLLSLAGGNWPAEHHGQPVPANPGRDLSDSIRSDAAVNREFLWWLHQGNRAIRQGDWKLVAERGGPWELYNLAQDRMENHNLAAEEPERAAELEELWNQTTDEFRQVVEPAPQAGASGR